jgi:2-oxoglutarate ferredoxin oxidoreductase subunit beta
MPKSIIYKKPDSFKGVVTHYCPGCGHGIVHKLIAEIIDELGVKGRTILCAPVGCSVLAYNYLDVDSIECAHGRAPSVATGIKRARPDLLVFTYQGDGDLAAIGTNETIHTANRGENITIIFINNAIYGMTGGQMAPTTLVGQKATTCPLGRNPANNEGKPIRVCEMLNTLDMPIYIERVTIKDPKNVRNTKRAIKKAFAYQLEKKGFSFVEVLSNCPTNWEMTPVDAMKFIEEKMMPVFPLGVFRDTCATASAEKKEE